MTYILPIITCLVTWFITKRYYMKGKKYQEGQIGSLEDGLKEVLEAVKNELKANKTVIKEERVEKAIEYYRKGSNKLKPYIDTLPDLSNDERAEIYDTTLLRVKGRRSKNNPYR